ncbi:uncharacterized protein IL334_005302 [Kwoniella shivajii]|uniref:Uncharacterized protein n=1 Tax=Kwoniella shivajii TaxID=564305 RepID=A0ABZ1D393_9TREE|nr:hypothetical protein IL334_005302 [Kwoniella shivajii]
MEAFGTGVHILPSSNRFYVEAWQKDEQTSDVASEFDGTDDHQLWLDQVDEEVWKFGNLDNDEAREQAKEFDRLHYPEVVSEDHEEVKNFWKKRVAEVTSASHESSC